MWYIEDRGQEHHLFPLLLTSSHSSFPRGWIEGKGYPDGIQRNEELSPRDKEQVKRLYGPPRKVVAVDPTLTPTIRTTTNTTGIPSYTA